MHDFNYYAPTEIIFGANSLDSLCECVHRYGGSRILLVYGQRSAVRSGLITRITSDLAGAGIPCMEFGGAVPNPTLEHAREGVRLARDFRADLILAAGGGSAIDTAKAIAIGAANPKDDIWDFWCRKSKPKSALPVGAILTISAAGSESSDSAVLTCKAASRKRGLNTLLYRPKFAIMNPELTYTLPPYQVACGVTDIMMHTMDRYFNPFDNEVTDAIAEALLRTVILRGPAAVKDAHDAEAMGDLMWAGSLSHNNLTGLGGVKDFSVHQLGHELSASFGTAHGASLATVWGSWARYVYTERPERFARFAANVWGIELHSATAGDKHCRSTTPHGSDGGKLRESEMPHESSGGRPCEDTVPPGSGGGVCRGKAACDMSPDDTLQMALLGIDAAVAFFKSIGMPTCFGENTDIGIQSEDTLRQLAYRCTYERSRTIGSFKKLDEEDIYKIYKHANI